MSVFNLKEEITHMEIKNNMDFAVKQIKNNLKDFTYNCQNHSSINNFYPKCNNDQWTSGFWVGEIWLAYEYSKDEDFKKSGNILVDSFLNRIVNKIEVDHHDMGFLYSLSCVASYKLTNNENAKKAAILSANNLIERFHEKGEFIQAWGEIGANDNYRYIIDCLLNLPLLYWATKETGDTKYENIAKKHINTCLTYSIRDNGSTHHTVFMNKNDGSFSHGATCQGYKDDSSWARGQAWGVYGTALSYAYCKDDKYIKVFDKVLDYYITRLPEDLVPYWDMIFVDGNEPRDSSSAVIVVCGLLEMAKYVDKEKSKYYISIAKKMMKSICTSYSVKDMTKSNGLLLHSTYSKKTPYNTCTEEGVDECTSWGDYFYLEALTRLSNNRWEMYW